MAESSYNSFKSRVLKFQSWAKENFKDQMSPDSFRRNDIIEFLQSSQSILDLNPQTRTNYLSDVL